MTFAQEASFIIAAYAVTIFVVVAMCAWVTLDYYAQRRVLGDLEARGITRRSGNRREDKR